jgi:ATP-binding cassette subfamily F protein 3
MAATIMSANNLLQRFGSDLVFASVTFIVTEREHIGLVGSNGAGKSSLLRILAGFSPAAGGEIAVANGLRVAYQAQEATFQAGRTVFGEALEAFAEVREVGQRMASLEQAMASARDTDLDDHFEEYSRLSTEFEARHGYEMEHRTAQVLSGLGLAEPLFEQPVSQLSGGQKTRVALAKALLSDPDLLLLDEPTNHLDLAATEWLESFLQTWNRAYLVVSHDRYFLDKVTNRTLELAFGRLEDYPAGYVRYLALRQERRALQQKEYDEQQAFIARTEEFVRKYKAGQRSREARGRATRLERIERIEAPPDHRRLNVTMRATVRSGKTVLSTTPLTIGYGGTDTAEPAMLVQTGEMVVERGDRIALIGPNGAGKTTALRTIVGEIPALEGRVSLGTNVRLAYYAQGHEGLDPELTVIETVLLDHPIGEEAARTLLGSFLFSDDDVFKPVSALSGGERSRLALARLTLADANFLVLDEPTNHLDILARETLESVLSGYDGTILFVSHDRFFIDQIANRIWAIEDGKLETYLGNYSDMTRLRSIKQRPVSEPKRPEPEALPATTPERPRRRTSDRQIRESQRRLTAAERTVSRLEERLNKLADELNVATSNQDVELVSRIGVEYEDLQNQLEAAYAEWSEASAEADALGAEVLPVLGGN